MKRGFRPVGFQLYEGADGVVGQGNPDPRVKISIIAVMQKRIEKGGEKGKGREVIGGEPDHLVTETAAKAPGVLHGAAFIGRDSEVPNTSEE